MDNQYKKPPLGGVAAKDKSKHNVTNLKQFYGLRKDINELRILVDKLSDHVAKRGRL